MRKLLLAWLFITLLAASAQAVYDYAANPLNFTYCYNNDQGSGTATELCGGRVYNGSLVSNTAWNTSGKFNGSISYGANPSYTTHGNALADINQDDNITVSFWFKQDSGTADKYFLEFGNGGDAVQYALQMINSNRVRLIYFTTANGGTNDFWDSTTNITQSVSGWHHLYAFWKAGRRSITVRVDGNETAGSWGGNGEGQPYGTNSAMRFGAYAGTTSGPVSDIDDLLIAYNKRNLTDTEIIDLAEAWTTTPILSGFNCTSCNTPNGDTTSPYTTSDTTPTFTLSTDINSNCRVGKTNQSYNDFGDSRNCSGQGAESHTCTLTSQDELTSATDYVWISCANLNNLSNWNSSGALQMEITGVGENALDLGIQASVLGSSATVYNNQQAYLRSISNQQLVSTVDRIVVYGNQRWLLNLDNTTALGLFNLSPAVYSGDFVNLTSSQIQHEVTALINGTKN